MSLHKSGNRVLANGRDLLHGNETAEGTIENAYTLKLMNLDETTRTFSIDVSGLPGIGIVGEREFAVEAGSISPLSLTVAMPSSLSDLPTR